MHHRRSVRLRGYDNARQGAYFVTICVKDRECWLGRVVDGEVSSSDFGAVVARVWEELPGRFPTVLVDAFVVMPNHIHGIVVVESTEGRGTALGEVVRALKAACTREIRASGLPGFAWQRGYYEHVIRNDADLDSIRQYIANNPHNWESDAEHPARREHRV